MLKDFYVQLRDNARLRWGVILIVAVLWLYAILVLHETLQEEVRLNRSTALSAARAQYQTTQTDWLTRVEPAKAMAVQLETRLWQAPTSGLAQAALQDVLTAAMQKAGVTRPQITVALVEDAATNATNTSPAAEKGSPADLWKVRAKISFDGNATALLDFLGQIEGNEKQIVVGALSFGKNLPNHGDLELYAYFQKPAAEPANTKPRLPS